MPSRALPAHSSHGSMEAIPVLLDCRLSETRALLLAQQDTRFTEKTHERQRDCARSHLQGRTAAAALMVDGQLEDF